MFCEKCGQETGVAYGVWDEKKKEIVSLCWDCYQKAIHSLSESNTLTNKGRTETKKPNYAKKDR